MTLLVTGCVAIVGAPVLAIVGWSGELGRQRAKLRARRQGGLVDLTGRRPA